MSKVAWIAVDWGTSNLRIWAMGAQGEVIERLVSDQGMMGLAQEEFEPLLVSHIEPWLGEAAMPVVACGMLGSRQGWIEAPYAAVPTQPATKTVHVPTRDARIDVRVISGLQQENPADVMRGEETQIAGFLAQNQAYSGVICLPGTHSKWAVIAAGQVTSFQTVLTGEMFDLLAGQSILKHSMRVWDDATFLSAAAQSLRAPEQLLTGLFSVRAAHLLKGDQNGKPALSGKIIGAELGALKPLWQGQKIILIGAGNLAGLYALALAKAGAEVQVEEVEAMTLCGLQNVFESEFL